MQASDAVAPLRILGRIRYTVTDEPTLKGVKPYAVDVKSSTVTITGSAPSLRQKNTVTAIAEKLSEGRRVINKLKVTGEPTPTDKPKA